MKNRSWKLLLSVLLVSVICAGIAAGLYAKTVTAFEPAADLQTGLYTLVLKGITPTGQSSGDYYMKLDPATNPGMQFAAFSASDADRTDRWKITRLSDTTCTIQNPARGENGYLNLTDSTLTYGPQQVLQFSHDGSTCVFYIMQGGNAYYIRFTNGGDTKEPRFTSGSGKASYQFYLYTDQTYEEEESGNADQPLPDVPPLLTIACISDLHCDYGLQSKDPFVRNSFIATATALSRTESADVLLVGGDMTSDNAKLAQSGGWSYETFKRVINQYEVYGGLATTTGMSLWCCGNHDFQAGAYDNYDAYADYETLMKDACGDPVSVYRQKQDSTLSDQRYPEHVLGMHYVLKDFDFLIINAPYEKSQQYSSGTYTWLAERLKRIGADKTVFILTHYPLYNSRGISTPDYGVSGDHYQRLVAILNKYPNVIHLYGHNHGGADSVYISDDTFERITSYTKTGKPVNNRNAVPTSFITAFMGSMSYYRNSFDPGWLDAPDPAIVQALMVYVYNDRIVFQMKNYGRTHVTQVPKSWTVMREVLNEATGSQGEDPGPEQPELPADPEELTRSLLVTADVNSAVRYDSAVSIRKVSLPENAVQLSSYSTSLTGAELKTSQKLTVRNVVNGDAYASLEEKLNAVVNEFYAYELIVKEGGSVVSPAGPLQVALRIPAGFGSDREKITYGVYYLSADGSLNMTDTVAGEKGMLSFILPENTVFAVSARANVADVSGNPGSDVTDLSESDKKTSSLIWVIVAVGIMICAAVVVLLILLRGRAKADGSGKGESTDLPKKK